MEYCGEDEDAWMLAACEQVEASRCIETANVPQGSVYGISGKTDVPNECAAEVFGGLPGGGVTRSERTQAKVCGAVMKQMRVTDSFRDVRDDGEAVITGFTPPSQTAERDVEESCMIGPGGLNLKRAETLLLPAKVPARQYQRDIIEAAVRRNTLVCLPTGTGKTLIAAAVMLNYLRWSCPPADPVAAGWAGD